MKSANTSSINNLLQRGEPGTGHRSRARATQLVPDFCAELALAQPPTDPELTRSMEDFLSECVLGAAWYQQRVAAAKRRALWYIALNAGLIAGLPLAVVGLGHIGTGGSFTGQATTVLTGILALQKTLDAWYTSQQRYAAWFKTGADLKTQYYDFIRTWNGRVGTTDPVRVVVALEDATSAARASIDAEELDYFQKLVLPSFDVLDMLTASRAKVGSLVTGLLPGATSTIATGGGKTALTQSTTSTAQHQASFLAPPASGSAQVTLKRVGSPKPNDDPYTIVIVANPALESPSLSGACASDPILQSPARFAACVDYILDAVFGHLPGQRETFMAAFESQVRVITIFDATLAAAPQNSLVGEMESSDIVEPMQDRFAAFLANYFCNGRPVQADIVFAVTDSATHSRCSAQFTQDDDARDGVAFEIDGQQLCHRFYNVQPGVVALHTSADTIVALHEFGHAASSFTNGTVTDLYVDHDSSDGLLNVRIGRPIPGVFANYRETTYQADSNRDGIGYPADWQSFHPGLQDPTFPAVMDNFYAASSHAPQDCRHDLLTATFLAERIQAIMSRP